MKTPEDLLDKLTEQIGEFVENGKQTQADIRQNLKSLIHSQLAKLDVVSREEFDAQHSILLKTRTQIEHLEKQLAELEAKLDETP